MKIKKRKVIFIFLRGGRLVTTIWTTSTGARKLPPSNNRRLASCEKFSIIRTHTQSMGVIYSYSVAETLRQWRVCIFYHSSFFFRFLFFYLYRHRISSTFYAHVPLKMLTLSSAHVSLNANAAWCDSRTLRSLYKMASSFPELQRKPLDILKRKKEDTIQLDYRAKHSSFQMSRTYMGNTVNWIFIRFTASPSLLSLGEIKEPPRRKSGAVYERLIVQSQLKGLRPQIPLFHRWHNRHIAITK